MDFLLYLTPQAKDIYYLISQKVKVVENAPICRKHKIYGWYQTDQRTMIMCTDRILSNPDAEYYMNETLYHEAAHIAQSCKNNLSNITPFYISTSLMPLSQRRKADLEVSVSINGERVRHMEHEAFWMEDKPEKVKSVLQKFCF